MGKKSASKEEKAEMNPPTDFVMQEELTNELTQVIGESHRSIAIMRIKIRKLEAIIEYWKNLAEDK